MGRRSDHFTIVSGLLAQNEPDYNQAHILPVPENRVGA